MSDVLHENNNYMVMVTQRQEDGCYSVINKTTSCVESFADNLPQAKVTAEQFNYLLEHNYHNVIIDDMFGPARERGQTLDFIKPVDLN